MKALHFSKWEGTGNDFVLVDDRTLSFPAADLSLVRHLCDRHFGIGSDGLILLQPPREAGTAYHMEFFNPDGSRSFCGNGSRCAFAAWSRLAGAKHAVRFTAVDGVHEAGWKGGQVAISLGPVPSVSRRDNVDQVFNGSPHELIWVPDPDVVDIMSEGSLRAHHPDHGKGGTNVNFLCVRHGEVHMRTFERGVEAETLSCGTGVVAAALSALDRDAVKTPVGVLTRGGRLTVEAERLEQGGWDHIRLIGPVRHVFDGAIDPSIEVK